MTALRRTMRGILRANGGSAMMEYVILLAFVVLPIAVFVYGDEGVFDFSSSSFGGAGSLIRAFYQQLQAGLSLPVP